MNHSIILPNTEMEVTPIILQSSGTSPVRQDIIITQIHDCTFEGMVKRWVHAAVLESSGISHNTTGLWTALCLAKELTTTLQGEDVGGRSNPWQDRVLLLHSSGQLTDVSPNSSLILPLGTVPHAQRKQITNSSSITHFILLAFADKRELQLLHFWLFLGIYLAALLSNGLIITTIACDHRLHTPMYFFLYNLSLLDFGSISTTVPKSMSSSLSDSRDISYSGCAAQLFFFVFFISAELFLLTVMAYDRYTAICRPLHYGTLLGSRVCVHMAAAAWGSGFLSALLHTANTFSIPLCKGNAVDQFFCEIPQILKLSCSHSYLREIVVLVLSACLAFGCFVFIVLSYVQIFRAVLRIPSQQGQHKAFSTCLPHMAVVSLFMSTGTFAYLKPPSISSTLLDLFVAVLYSVVPSVLNPLIYNMRNQELKDAVWKLVTGCS
ncbi:olfactory receptor 14A16 [Opisthocomus hoazin]|uniref:olfactory receptor 14A16 n=1 Tax=Opisthocomus hoazin TaxID=30419 RepID=UPI003F531167